MAKSAGAGPRPTAHIPLMSTHIRAFPRQRESRNLRPRFPLEFAPDFIGAGKSDR